MTPATLLAAFLKLKPGHRDGKRLPHKPLLALLALGRWEAGDRGPIAYAAIEGELGGLIRAYGPPGAGNPQEPFWRMRRDGPGQEKLWELDGLAHVTAPAAVTPPRVTELRAAVTGRFSAPVRTLFDADPTLPRRVARALLEANFPSSLHPAIAAQVGLDLTDEPIDRAGPTKSRRRNPAFRDKVLKAYGNRCALCRVKLHLGLSVMGVEAAHIQWFSEGGPDDVRNGLALCAFHHQAFDLGAFTVGADGRAVVSEEVNGDGADVLLGGGPIELLAAACAADRPEDKFLDWHRRQVFKGRAKG